MKKRILFSVILFIILLSATFIAGAGSEAAKNPVDQSWMRPIPQERAVYASIPELKEAPPALTIASIEKTDSGNLCTVDGLTAWGVTAETLNGSYFNSNYEEIESTLAAVGDGKWAAEIPEGVDYITYMTADTDGNEIWIMLQLDYNRVSVEIHKASAVYYIMDNETISMEWQLSDTEQINASYIRATGDLIGYDVTIAQDLERLYYLYEPDGAGGMELTEVDYSFEDSSSEYGQKTYMYTRANIGWDQVDFDTGEMQENVEVSEEILSRCIELPLI